MRLIDAEAFFEEEFKRCGGFPLVGTCSKDNEYLGNRLSVAPTIEAKPVVHAHWIEQIIDGGQELMCSNCGEYALMNDEFYSEFSKYCPYCGAQMDEKENDNGT